MDGTMSGKRAEQTAKSTGMDPIFLASIGSVLLSWYYFYVKGDRERGIFVGLWPPTLLAASNYLRQVRVEKMLEGGAGDIRAKIQRMLADQ
jgi:hypothetical protein